MDLVKEKIMDALFCLHGTVRRVYFLVHGGPMQKKKVLECLPLLLFGQTLADVFSTTFKTVVNIMKTSEQPKNSCA